MKGRERKAGVHEKNTCKCTYLIKQHQKTTKIRQNSTISVMLFFTYYVFKGI